MHNAERDSEQRAHRDNEDQHTETQSGVGLHAAGEQLGAALVHAANIRYVGATVFISDRAANDGLGAQPREQERQNSGDCTRQEITCYERAGAVDLRKRSFRWLSSQKDSWRPMRRDCFK